MESVISDLSKPLDTGYSAESSKQHEKGGILIHIYIYCFFNLTGTIFNTIENSINNILIVVNMIFVINYAFGIGKCISKDVALLKVVLV